MPRKLARKNTSKKSGNNDAQELRKIERLLGEDFDTLAQARRALKRESVPAKKQSPVKKSAPSPARKSAPPSAPKNKSINSVSTSGKNEFTLQELKPKQTRTINAFLKDDATADQISAAELAPGQLWGAEISHEYTDIKGRTQVGHAKTLKLYTNLRQLFKKLSEYLAHGKMTPAQKREFISGIKIVKYGAPISGNSTLAQTRLSNAIKWQKEKIAERGERVKRKKAIAKQAKVAEVKYPQLQERFKAEQNARKKAEKELAKLRKKKG
jgi:hypothetical protein